MSGIRRIARVLAVTMVALVAIVAGPTTTAQAMSATVGGVTYTPLNEHAGGYSGWGLLGAVERPCLNCHLYAAQCVGCPMPAPIYGAPQLSYRNPTIAWRWSGTAWSSSKISSGTWMWIQPYAADWSWAWSQATGWVAIQDRNILTYRYGA